MTLATDPALYDGWLILLVAAVSAVVCLVLMKVLR